RYLARKNDTSYVHSLLRCHATQSYHTHVHAPSAQPEDCCEQSLHTHEMCPTNEAFLPPPDIGLYVRRYPWLPPSQALQFRRVHEVDTVDIYNVLRRMHGTRRCFRK